MVQNLKFATFVATAAFMSTLNQVQAAELALGPTVYTAAGDFPTKAYSSYWNNPTDKTQEPNPVIYDPLYNIVYPEELSDPNNLPEGNFNETTPLPVPVTPEQFYAQAFAQMSTINASSINDTCTKCKMMLEVAKFVSLTAPSYGSNVSVNLCNFYKSESTPESCEQNYGQYAQGPFLTQLFAVMDAAGLDGQLYCQNAYSACPLPPTTPLNISEWLPPKPAKLPSPRKPSGELLKVLHLSDFHIDPRFKVGSEANCSAYLCCRGDQHNSVSPNQIVFPAPRFGAYQCDTPQDLALAVLEAIPVLTGTEETGFDMTIFTGDLVPHDPSNALSRGEVLEIEAMIYQLWKRELKTGPIYACEGNHDTDSQAVDVPHSMPYPLGEEMQWNYDHLVGLWELDEWITPDIAAQARFMYGSYSTIARPGLRIISFNSDVFYTGNIFNFINVSNPDNFGVFRFIIEELLIAEEAGDRVWLMRHHPTGWNEGQALLNPTDLLYQIVDRFSETIAEIFTGHTHEDEHVIFYANNGTNISAETAVGSEWGMPSVTPLTDLNSGFRMYYVDSNTFNIHDALTYYADVNSFPALDNETTHGPVFQLEYSTREAYNVFGWPEEAPLNATFWHLVTEAMEKNSSLVEKFHYYQSKSSVKTTNCTTECQQAKICYMRSASVSLSKKNCPDQSWGSAT